MRVSHLRAAEEAALYSELVHAGQPGLVELVTAKRLPDGTLRMRSRSDRVRLPAGRRRRARSPKVSRAPGGAARRRSRARSRAPSPCPARRPSSGDRVAWVDLDRRADEPDWPAVAAARRSSSPRAAACTPTGASTAQLGAAGVESLNRRLAARFDGDLACTDRGRIMRLPGSFNGKRGAWCAIRRADLTARAARRRARRRGAARPRPAATAAAADDSWRAPDDDLATLTPPRYFALLCGLDVPASGGYVSCPLHEERTASCMVWPDERGWWCFGCCRGGGIYDLASLLDGRAVGARAKGRRFRRECATALSALPRARPVGARPAASSRAALKPKTRRCAVPNDLSSVGCVPPT